MNSIITYLKFCFKATNQHGVHSPFIYKFVTQCLYAKPRRFSGFNKQDCLIYKATQYFNFLSALLINSTSEADKPILKANSKIDIARVSIHNSYDNFRETTFDVISVDHLENTNSVENLLQKYSSKIKNTTVLIFKQPYVSDARLAFWEQLKQNALVTVTVDCFCMGFVFFRKEQAKEHFKIRM